MKGRFFLDTNVLVYANDSSNRSKQARARELIAEAFSSRLGCLSTQVLQEFFVAAVGKAHVPAENVRRQIERLADLQVIQVDLEQILGAVDLHLTHRLSFWDGLIIRSAAAGNCGVLYTEDLSAGQVIADVRICNPFAK